MTEKAFKKQHAIARSVIEGRWHGKPFEKIAQELQTPTDEIRNLRTTKTYQDLVWAEYGRSPHLFNQHEKREDCIINISRFFGITTEKANEVLGTDWKASPPPNPIQIKMNF